MTRVPEPTRDELDPDTRAALRPDRRDARSGGRSVRRPAPPSAALRARRRARRAAPLPLRAPGADRELAILTVGREIEAAYEWVAHEVIARREGTRPRRSPWCATAARRPGSPRARRSSSTPCALYRARRLTRAGVRARRGGARAPESGRARDAGGLLRDDRRHPQRLRRGPAARRGAALPARWTEPVATFGLVHGAGHGAWCWERLIPALAALGHRAWAMDLPVR